MSTWLARALALAEQDGPTETHDPHAAKLAKSAKCVREADYADYAQIAHGGPHRSPDHAAGGAGTPSSPFADGLLGEWQRGSAKLPFDRAPCPLFRDWPLVCRSIDRFLKDHGAEAVDLGWTALELFGVHHLVGCIRADCAGALVTGSETPVTTVTADAIRYAHGQTYRRMPIPGGGQVVPIWGFGR